MLKNPERFLSKEKITAVIRVPDALHELISKRSSNDFEDVGEVYVKNKQVLDKLTKIIFETNEREKEFYSIHLTKSSQVYGIFTENVKTTEDEEGEEVETFDHNMIEYSILKVKIRSILTFRVM